MVTCFRIAALALTVVTAVGPHAAAAEPASDELDIRDREASSHEASFGFAKTKGKPQPSNGSANVLVLFAGFRGDTGPLPSYADSLFDPKIEGSLAHYYDTMSFGQLRVSAILTEGRFASRWGPNTYLAPNDHEFGKFGQFAKEVLARADVELDFGVFDNDGPDGIPNSGDDDGEVDYVFLMLPNVPHRFIIRWADGVAQLGFDDPYLAADRTPSGDPIRVSGQTYKGLIVREGSSFYKTVGLMIHEYGHGLGLPDLYNTAFIRPPGQDKSADGAGIGKWGVMGYGANGWSGNTPTTFSAYCRQELGWVGIENDRLIEVVGDTTNLEIRDVFDGGHIVKIPLRTGWVSPGAVFVEEYLLLEHRARSVHLYNRDLPGEGLLVWHVRPQGKKSQPEDDKLVDLICADGLYGDAGSPAGDNPDPLHGGDNLDHYAVDAAYREAHNGNKGDAQDLFDGVRHTRLDLTTNPSTAFGRTPQSGLSSGLTIDMRRTGNATVVDITRPRWSGVIEGEVEWTQDVIVDGDITVAADAKLVIYGGARVRFAGSDGLEAGEDPRLCEFNVQGTLEAVTKTRFRMEVRMEGKDLVSIMNSQVSFEAQRAGESWAGVVFAEDSEYVGDDDGYVVLDAERSSSPGPGPDSGMDAEIETVIEEADPSLYQALVDTFGLQLNYPNPFDLQTTIPYSLAEGGDVELVIYNSIGQVVRRLVDTYQFAGLQQTSWDARDDEGQSVASGVYIHQLAQGSRAARGKMLHMGGYARLDDTDRATFGFAGGQQLSLALRAGRHWADLEFAMMGAAEDRPAVQTAAETLSTTLGSLGMSALEAESVNAALADIESSDAEELLVVRRAIGAAVASLGSGPLTLFSTGEWLVSLRRSSLEALEQDVPLATVREISRDAAVIQLLIEEVRLTSATALQFDALGDLLEGGEQTPARAVLDEVERLLADAN